MTNRPGTPVPAVAEEAVLSTARRTDGESCPGEIREVTIYNLSHQSVRVCIVTTTAQFRSGDTVLSQVGGEDTEGS
jgi:hypothetical protein